jgi:hypothetical protein
MSILPSQPPRTYSVWLLYSIFVLWGILAGAMYYIIARFPLWLTYSTGPSSDVRGPFFDTGVLYLMGLGGIFNAVLFSITVRWWRGRIASLKWIYLVNGILIVLCAVCLIVLVDYFQNPELYRLGHFRFGLVALLSVPSLVCVSILGSFVGGTCTRLLSRS